MGKEEWEMIKYASERAASVFQRNEKKTRKGCSRVSLQIMSLAPEDKLSLFGKLLAVAQE